MIPANSIAINDVDQAKKILALMDEFEEHDDVQNVYANFDIPDEIISQVQS